MDLIIVESPNKVHTISKIMGGNYKVLATAGHIMEFESVGAYRTGIDVINDFKMSMVFDKTKKDLLKKIKDAAKEATTIFICSDGDREGEYIADEIRHLLSAHKKKFKRAIFNEITDKAVKNAIANPINFNEELIGSAMTRATLDRLVGYRLSPIALSKLNCESAGRVQSALLKLICEKEISIQKFKPTKYTEIFLDFKKGRSLLTAKLREIKGKKVERLTDPQLVKDVLDNCKPGEYLVDSITEKEKSIEPKKPLTTAALQQIASNNFGFAPSRTMKAAQHLFEKGYITYLRTDSCRYSDEFIAECKSHIEKVYGKSLYRGLILSEKDNADAQNGHESIHQTDLKNTPEKVSQLVEGDEAKLYKLIYNYSLAALFVPAKVKDTEVTIANGTDYKFKISGRVVTFESYLQLFNDVEDVQKLPEFKKGDKINDIELYPEEKETQAPQRYSEAGLVKLMQTTGIGRPSSYAGTIETLKKREYIAIEKKAVHATEKGLKLNKMLQEYFPDVINEDYTSKMESFLDEIADGKKTRVETLREFWNEFEPLLLKAAREINKDKPKLEIVEGKKCPDCGADLVVREGKFGKFHACSKFPKCKYTAKIEDPNKKDEKKIQCPECGDGIMILRKSKKGSTFYGCSRWPACNKTFTEDSMKEYLIVTNRTADNSADRD